MGTGCRAKKAKVGLMRKSYDIPIEVAISTLKELAYCRLLTARERDAIKYALIFLMDFAGMERMF